MRVRSALPLLVLPALLAGALATPAAAAETSTSLSFASDPSEFIGQGRSLTIEPTSTRQINGFYRGETSIDVYVIDNGIAQMSARFSGPFDEETLELGRTYDMAQGGGMHFTRESRGCPSSEGQFTVTELAADATTQRVSALSMTWRARCDDGDGWYRGSVVIGSSTPAAPVPPSPPLPAPVPQTRDVVAEGAPRQVAYANDADLDGGYDLALLDLDTRKAVVQEQGRPDVVLQDPAISPDGRAVAWSTGLGTTFYPVLIRVAPIGDGTLPERNVTRPVVTDDARDRWDVAPSWSPDGSQLVFTRITVPRTEADDVPVVSEGLFLVSVDGGPATSVPGTLGALDADWNADGTRLVFSDGDGRLRSIATDGSDLQDLGVEGESPRLSPDGRTIAYTTVTDIDPDDVRAADVVQVALLPLAGGTPTVLPTRLPAERSAVGAPAWAPDGRSVLVDVYGYDAEGFPLEGDLWAADVSGLRAGPLRLTPGDEVGPSASGPAPTAVSSGTPSSYVPLDPRRVLDTRDGTGQGFAGKAQAGSAVRLQVPGLPADASAVVLNITATAATASTDVRAYPWGSPVPTVSSLNLVRGATAANLVTVPVGEDGAVALRSSAGEVHLLADVAGYYRTTEAADGFAGVDPVRVLDTRSGLGARAGRLPAGGSVDLQLAGVHVPDDATAVVLNVTATGASSGTDLRVYPAAGTGVPLVSNLNLAAGATVANLVTVKVGPGGSVRLRNAAGLVHVIADLAGYYSPSAPGRFVPTTPARLLDTRNGTGAGAAPSGAGGLVDLAVGGARGLPADATAAVLNVTGVGASAATDVRLYPASASSVPVVSNLNLARGGTRPNAAVVTLSDDGRVRIRNGAGSVHLLADLAGFFVAR